MNRVLILGINGQDGSILASLFLNEGWDVIGTVRSKDSSFWRLENLDILKRLKSPVILDPTKYEDVNSLIKSTQPKIIIPLSSVTSVGYSYNNSNETYSSNILLIDNICKAIVSNSLQITVFNPLSSEMYGNINEKISYNSKINPTSPYGIAKATCKEIGEYYLKVYGMNIHNIVLFNHESELRGDTFVTKKIIVSAIRIKNKLQNKLVLGNTDIIRDWGCAFEYCSIIKNILINKKAENGTIIATGESNSLENFVRVAFEYHDLNFRDYLEVSETYMRKNEIKANFASIESIPDKELIPKLRMKGVIERVTKKIENEGWY